MDPFSLVTCTSFRTTNVSYQTLSKGSGNKSRGKLSRSQRFLFSTFLGCSPVPGRLFTPIVSQLCSCSGLSSHHLLSASLLHFSHTGSPVFPQTSGSFLPPGSVLCARIDICSLLGHSTKITFSESMFPVTNLNSYCHYLTFYFLHRT